jgi:hypothetical protein
MINDYAPRALSTFPQERSHYLEGFSRCPSKCQYASRRHRLYVSSSSDVCTSRSFNPLTLTIPDLHVSQLITGADLDLAR